MVDLTIRIKEEVKDELEKLKLVPMETYNNVIKRLIKEYKNAHRVKENITRW